MSVAYTSVILHAALSVTIRFIAFDLYDKAIKALPIVTDTEKLIFTDTDSLQPFVLDNYYFWRLVFATINPVTLV